MGETYTVPIDLSGVPDLKDGVRATIQAVCHQPKFDIYQCADVVIDAPGPSTTTQTLPLQTTVQKLHDSLVEHISIENGCAADLVHLPENALSKNLAALWIRAAFHDNIAPGSLPLFLQDPANLGIGDSIVTKFVSQKAFNLSRSDVIALAGQLTVAHCGGPNIAFSAGRLDATPIAPGAFLPDDALDSYQTMKHKLVRMGFSNEDIVVLVMGSHSMGGAHRRISPHATKKDFQPFDDTPGIFDNNIFKKALNGACILNIDCQIAKDPELKPLIQK
ncbi:heme peroxidase [Gorgonomyces haynaldii]|nr:heme peroxidase [Gorgonomyces haynaldii]KAI8905985.1 heme peroxidase [Gorgonomyces haynaldii]